MIVLVEIVVDTGVLIGYGWTNDTSHAHCCRFFKKFPAHDHAFYYPKKVKGELTHVRKKIARENADFAYEMRLLHRFVREFLRNARKLDYENSTYNWELIFDTVAAVMMIFQQKKLEKISFDADHVTHYVCFCLDREGNSDHFFITTDAKIHGARKELGRAVRNALAEEVEVNIKNIWDF